MKKPAKKVLLVDDKAENLYLLKSLLSGNGFVVEQALNGEEALKIAREKHPDMIVSDILMPVMDGFALCHEVKTDESLKDTPFVFYTASYLDQRDKELALNLGVDRYIIKPQEPEDLLQVFQEVMSQHDDDTKKIAQPTILETDYLKEHNESLIRMLEKKLEQLDLSKRVLEEEIVVRREAEAKLQASLKEKDVLLKEVYHRTKNNMQVIVGLLDLQARKAGKVPADVVFKEMSDRIYSMSMVHDLLYRSKSLYEIQLDRYLHDLSNRLLTVHNQPQQDIELALEVDHIPVNIQFAIPLGLVITEMISNSLKYAFKDRSRGRITITAHLKKDAGLLLSIADDGVGLDESVDLNSDNTLGLYIIRSIVENQLFGAVDFTNENGLTYDLTLPDLLLDVKTF